SIYDESTMPKKAQKNLKTNYSKMIFLILIVILALIVGARYIFLNQQTPSSRASAPNTICHRQFNDVSQSNPFYLYISCAACSNLMSGYADNTFRPAAFITRTQLAKILSSDLGLTNPTSPHQIFADVPIN